MLFLYPQTDLDCDTEFKTNIFVDTSLNWKKKNNNNMLTKLEVGKMYTIY